MLKLVNILIIHCHAQLYDNYVGHDNVCKQEVTSKQLGNKHIPAFTRWIMQFAMYKKHTCWVTVKAGTQECETECET